jgi:hypothetical protein
MQILDGLVNPQPCVYPSRAGGADKVANIGARGVAKRLRQFSSKHPLQEILDAVAGMPLFIKGVVSAAGNSNGSWGWSR